MRELTAEESKLLARYLKLRRVHDRFRLFKASRESSNLLLDSAEAAIPKQDPSSYQLTYLQGISRRKSRNYRKLRGMDQLLRVTEALMRKTLEGIRLGRDA